MYDTEIALDRNFMRRMIRAYEQDLLQLVNETPDHPGGDWAQEHLQMLELLRQQTFSPLKQSVTFWSWWPTRNYCYKFNASTRSNLTQTFVSMTQARMNIIS